MDAVRVVMKSSSAGYITVPKKEQTLRRNNSKRTLETKQEKGGIPIDSDSPSVSKKKARNIHTHKNLY